MHRFILLLLTLVLTRNAAYANFPDICYINNFYVGIFGGPNTLWTGSSRLPCNSDSQVFQSLATYKNQKVGYQAGCKLGYRYLAWRFEGEYSFRSNPIKSRNFFLGSTAIINQVNQNNSLIQHSWMGNLIWEPLVFFGCPGIFWDIQPYIGLGIGYDRMLIIRRFCNQIPNSTPTTGPIRFRNTFRRRQDYFTWQAIAGLRIPFCYSFDLSIDYVFHRGSPARIIDQSVIVGLDYKFFFSNY